MSEPPHTRPAHLFVACLATWAFSTLVAAAVVAAVNPLGVFRHRLFTPMVWLDRDDKAAAFIALPTRPRILILGSSRSMKINPRDVERLTGLPAFNFSVNSARAEDYEAIVEFAQGHAQLSRIIIGVDPEAFHNNWPPDNRLTRSIYLGPYTTASAPLAASDFLGTQVLVSSARSAYLHLRGGTPARRASFGTDGFLTYNDWEPELANGRLDFARNLAASIKEYRARFVGFTELSPERAASFTRTLERARANGTTVDAFLSQLHPLLTAALADTPLAVRTADTDVLLRDLAHRGLLRYCPVAGLEAFGGEPSEFFDGGHMTETNSSRLFRYVEGCPRMVVH